MRAQAAIATGETWQDALEALTPQLSMLRDGTSIDLTLLFASADYADAYPALLAAVRKLTGPGVLIGCSGQGIIGPSREVEGEPALSLQVFSLPGVDLRPVRISQNDLTPGGEPDWQRRANAPRDEVNAWLLFADPFTLDTERALELLSETYEGLPLIGGLASGHPRRQETHLFLNDNVLDEGAVGLAIGGDYTVRTVVSQGAAPIGETWTITAVEGNMIETIGMRRALDVLVDTFNALPEPMQERARSNLLIGLAMDEYKDEYGRGDFLIRNFMGVDRDTGAIAVSALPRVGQTLQFQVRDPAAADEDLHEILSRVKADLGDQQPVGALLCSCNGRGIGLFGAPDHDAKKLAELMGPLPVAGFFCNGEIGPVGGKNFLHGFTASMALIVQK